MVKISRIAMIERRVTQLRKRVKVDTEKLRRKLLLHLEEIFEKAAELANSNNLLKHTTQLHNPNG